jgi:hypothetical protein
MNDEQEKNRKSLNKKSFVSNMLPPLASVILITMLTSFNGEWVIRALGGLTVKELEKTPVHSPIDYFEEVKEGKYIRYADLGAHSSINWGKDEDDLLDMNLEPDREVFMRTIRVKYRSVLDICVTAGATYDAAIEGKKFGLVMSRIKINGIDIAKDTSSASGIGRFPVYSSAACSKLLEPGQYHMLVEGIFSGCVRNHDAWMQMKITRHQAVPFGELHALKTGGYFPVSNGFVSADIQSPERGVFRDLIIGKLDTHDRSTGKQ